MSETIYQLLEIKDIVDKLDLRIKNSSLLRCCIDNREVEIRNSQYKEIYKSDNIDDI